MVSTPTNSLRLQKPGAGDQVNTWGTSAINGDLDLIDTAIAGNAAIVVSGSFTLTSTNYASDQARSAIITLSGTPGSAFTVTTPNVSKFYLVVNNANASATFSTGAGTTVTIPSGRNAIIECNAINWYFVTPPSLLDTNGLSTPTNNNDPCTKLYADNLAFTANAGILPGQGGNAGKFLSTNGTTASWATPNTAGGASVTSTASSFALTSTSNRSQNVTFTAQGQSVTLPDATTCQLGGPIFSISNAGQYAFAVRRNDASILTVLPPGASADIYLDVNGTAKGTWHAVGQNLLAGLLYTPSNSLTNTTYQGASGFWQCGNTVVLLGAGVSSGVLYAQAIDVSQTPCVVGPAVLVSSVFNSIFYTNQIVATVIDTTHLLVAFQSTSANAIQGVVLTLTGSSISVSGVTTLATGSASSGLISSIVTLSTSLAVMLYSNGTNCYTVAIALSGGSIGSAGTPVALTSATGYLAPDQTYTGQYSYGTAPLVALSATSFIAVAGGSSVAYAQAGTVSGTAITLGNSVSSGSFAVYYTGFLLLTANTVMLIGPGSGNQSFQVMTVTGNTITAGTVYTNATSSGQPIAVILFSATSVGVLMDQTHYMVLSVSGLTVSQAVAPATVTAGSNQQNLINQGSSLLAWNGPITGNVSTADTMFCSIMTASGVTNSVQRFYMPPGLISSITPVANGNYALSGNYQPYTATGALASSNSVQAYKFNGTTPQFLGLITGGANDGPTKFWPLSATQMLVGTTGAAAQILEMAS